MEHEERLNIAQKLLYVQQNLKAPKGQYNQFGKYNYRSCEDIQEALKPLLSEVKAVLLLNDELVQVGERFYIRAAAIFQDTESSESITNTAYARECDSRAGMDAAQVTGSCSSYARKYALNGLFCIDDAKDPDTMDNSGAERQQGSRGTKPPQQSRTGSRTGTRPATGISPRQQEQIKAEAERTGTDLQKVYDRYGVKNLAEMTPEQHQRAMLAFSKMDTVPPPVENEQLELFSDFSQYDGETPFR